MMNKFHGPSDADYQKVAHKIEEILQKIRKKEADDWIRDKQYTEERLKIERLSGDLLPMDQCYINLAIVEHFGQDIDRAEGDAAASPFSLLARQKVQTPDQPMQINLATVFNKRKGRDGRTIQPRRIFIRGRAGVGKTTLCKKIVYEFSRGNWSKWTKIFDRVLWVPLRNLKLPERRHVPGYNFEHLFHHEYFSLPNNRPELAKKLSNILDTMRSKTLFLLDGLDEVSHDLGGKDDMSRFLQVLLDQPNVIITSRPSVNTPNDADLELETVGFYPDQVKAYLQTAFDDPKRIDEVQSFLHNHWLIQNLVRIPILLDALCYTWVDFGAEDIPQTMTSIYQTIEGRLWRKDILRLEKNRESYVRTAHPSEIELTIKDESRILGCLAFTGLLNNVIDFTPDHRDDIRKQLQDLPLNLSLDEILARLSFLRTSNPSSKDHNRN